jgi:hypothetical protein
MEYVVVMGYHEAIAQAVDVAVYEEWVSVQIFSSEVLQDFCEHVEFDFQSH